jgi:hypothetical protein
MDPTIAAAEASAVAAAAAALAAFVSLGVAWNAKRIQGKAADFSNCLEVVGQLRAAQDRVFTARNDDERYRFEFVELLNLLEALALLYNDGKIAASTKKFTGKFLDQVVAWIRVDESMKRLMDSSMTGDDTYGELKKFENRRRPLIRGLARDYSIQRGIR